MWKVIREDELYHHGIKGQKWGVRRFQNPDGTLTSAGKKRYNQHSDGSISTKSMRTKRLERQLSKITPDQPRIQKETTQMKLWTSRDRDKKTDAARKALKVGVAVAGTALAAYGAYKMYQFVGNKKLISEGQSFADNFADSNAANEFLYDRSKDTPLRMVPVSDERGNIRLVQMTPNEYKGHLQMQRKQVEEVQKKIAGTETARKESAKKFNSLSTKQQRSIYDKLDREAENKFYADKKDFDEQNFRRAIGHYMGRLDIDQFEQRAGGPINQVLNLRKKYGMTSDSDRAVVEKAFRNNDFDVSAELGRPTKYKPRASFNDWTYRLSRGDTDTYYNFKME